LFLSLIALIGNWQLRWVWHEMMLIILLSERLI